jgi:hypothetical protein
MQQCNNCRIQRLGQNAGRVGLPVGASLAGRYFVIAKLNETGAERWSAESMAVMVSS